MWAVGTNDSMLFTFYYIYIKTLLHLPKLLDIRHLHSTIFILKPRKRMLEDNPFKFTFYYIYIKTKYNGNVNVIAVIYILLYLY